MDDWDVYKFYIEQSGTITVNLDTPTNTSDADLHFRLDSLLESDLDLLDADHDGSISAAELRAYSKQRNIAADVETGDKDGKTTS